MHKVSDSCGATDLPDIVKLGFTDGTFYDKYRPEYTPESVDKVISMVLGEKQRNNEKEYSLLELGAGTGKLTRPLTDKLPKNVQYLASEPMQSFYDTLKVNCPNVNSKQFSAENIPLPSNSVHNIICGQCFHWFARSALCEIERVLQPGGNLVLLWNQKSREAAWLKDVLDIFDRHHATSERHLIHESREWKNTVDSHLGFHLQEYIPKMFYPIIQLTRESFTHHILSLSVISRLNNPEKEKIKEEIRELLEKNPETKNTDALLIPMYTEIVHYVKL